MLVRMKRQKEFSKKIGLVDTSSFREEKDTKKTNVKVNQEDMNMMNKIKKIMVAIAATVVLFYLVLFVTAWI